MNCDRVAAYGHTTFDVILRAIGIVNQVRLPGTGLMVPIKVTEHKRIKQVRIALRIAIRIFRLARIAENHHVTLGWVSVSREFLVAERNRRTVSELEAQQKVTRMQGVFHRPARNLERLNHILNYNQRERHRDDDFPEQALCKLFPRKRLFFFFHKNQR